MPVSYDSTELSSQSEAEVLFPVHISHISSSSRREYRGRPESSSHVSIHGTSESIVNSGTDTKNPSFSISNRNPEPIVSESEFSTMPYFDPSSVSSA